MVGFAVWLGRCVLYLHAERFDGVLRGFVFLGGDGLVLILVCGVVRVVDVNGEVLELVWLGFKWIV